MNQASRKEGSMAAKVESGISKTLTLFRLAMHWFGRVK
jgi:hypothetical protein